MSTTSPNNNNNNQYSIQYLPGSTSLIQIFWGSLGILPCNSTSDCPPKAGCYLTRVHHWPSQDQCSCDFNHGRIGLQCEHLSEMGILMTLIHSIALILAILILVIIISILFCNNNNNKSQKIRLRNIQDPWSSTLIVILLGTIFFTLDSIYEIALNMDSTPRSSTLPNYGVPPGEHRMLTMVSSVGGFFFWTLALLNVSLTWIQIAQRTKLMQEMYYTFRKKTIHPLKQYQNFLFGFYGCFLTTLIVVLAIDRFDLTWYVLSIACVFIVITYGFGFILVVKAILPTIQWQRRMIMGSSQQQHQQQQLQQPSNHSDNILLTTTSATSIASSSNSIDVDYYSSVNKRLAHQLRLVAYTAITICILTICVIVVALLRTTSISSPLGPTTNLYLGLCWIFFLLDLLVIVIYIAVHVRFSATWLATSSSTMNNNNNNVAGNNGSPRYQQQMQQQQQQQQQQNSVQVEVENHNHHHHQNKINSKPILGGENNNNNNDVQSVAEDNNNNNGWVNRKVLLERREVEAQLEISTLVLSDG
jgi:hypothetical protein